MKNAVSESSFCLAGGFTGLAGVLLLGTSFAINTGPPASVANADLLRFGQQHYASILWGAWLQAVGPVLIVFFAFSLVHLAGAAQRMAGWMTLFGATTLMTVSLIEITFYISALHSDPAVMPAVSLAQISAVQHLYFIVAAPALFFPLGLVLLGSPVLPRVFGYAALLLGLIFCALGAIFTLTLTLPAQVTALGSIQAVWWLSAAVALIVRGGRLKLAQNSLTSMR